MSLAGPAGLSRLRLPIAPPGRAAVNGRRYDGAQQRLPDARRALATEAVGDDDAFDHVADHQIERAAAQQDRHHRAARESTDRARDSGAARRCAKRGDRQAGRTGRRTEPANGFGELERGSAIHRPH